MRTYKWTVEGVDANNNQWKTNGEIECEWTDVFRHVNFASFHQLTEGKAVFGDPGKGCTGPYNILRLAISTAPQILSYPQTTGYPEITG